MSSLFGSMADIRRKIFTSYHHGGDQTAYEIFSQHFHDTLEAVTDNSLSRAVDSEDVDYVMRRIREEHISGTSCTIVLVGAETWKRKYVDWEIKATLDKYHGLIGVRLPSAPIGQSGKVIVPARLHDNIASGFAVWTDWASITQSKEACTGLIEAAKARELRLISNGRERMQKNLS